MHRTRTLVLAVVAALSLLCAPALAQTEDHEHSTEHGDMHGKKVRAASGTRMSIEVVKDPFSGWNLLIDTRRFRFAPQHASQDHRSGEGHAHLEIDGKPITRIYGVGYYISELSPGRHRIRVALATNNHAEYVNGKGRAIADTTTVNVPKPAN